MTRPAILDRLAPGGLCVLALAARLALWSRTSGLTMDSPLYVRMAEALLAGARGPSPAHHGYPLLVAAASWLLPGRELPGRIVSLATSLAVPVLAWALARRRTGAAPALAAGVVVALHPLLAVFGVAIMTESAFLAVVLAGLLLAERQRPFAGGVCLGLAYAIRPEALVIAPLAALLTGRRRAAAWVLAGAVLASAPYLGLLRWELGRWSPSPKVALVHAPAASAHAAEWRLAGEAALPDSVGLGERLQRDVPAILAAYPRALTRHARALETAWPWGLLALSLAGLTRREAWGPALAPLALPFVFPLLAVPFDARFELPLVPVLAALAAASAERARRPWSRALAALALAGGTLALASGPAARQAWSFDDGPMSSLRGAGIRLAALGPPGARVMDRKSYVPFFAGMTHVQLPDDDLARILAYARSQRVNYLVVEEYVAATLRPQLRALLDPAGVANEPGVTLAFALRPAPGEGVAVYRIDPR